MDKKILIIDDDKGICMVVGKFLEKRGFDVIAATSGKDGLKAANKFKPDLILLDIAMPKMDGFTVLEKLKYSQETLPIPVIMLTARGDEESKLKASSLYSHYYLVKPFDMEELVSQIEKALKIPK